jgi:transposase
MEFEYRGWVIDATPDFSLGQLFAHARLIRALQELVDLVASDVGCSKRAAQEIIEAVLQTVTDAVGAGGVGRVWNVRLQKSLPQKPSSATPGRPSRTRRKTKRRYDRGLYRTRNLVERFFNRIKHFRRVSTRYGKLADSYLVFVSLACVFGPVINVNIITNASS